MFLAHATCWFACFLYEAVVNAIFFYLKMYKSRLNLKLFS